MIGKILLLAIGLAAAGSAYQASEKTLNPDSAPPQQTASATPAPGQKYDPLTQTYVDKWKKGYINPLQKKLDELDGNTTGSGNQNGGNAPATAQNQPTPTLIINHLQTSSLDMHPRHGGQHTSAN